MKVLILVLAVVLSTAICWAHDEGHGPRITDAPIYGGIVAPVIRAEHVKQGRKAPLVYKGELLRSEDGTFRVYVYTPNMTPISLSKFEKKAKAIVETKAKSRWEKQEVTLTLSGNTFIGKLPKGPIRKPYNLDVFITENGKAFLVAFDNLD